MHTTFIQKIVAAFSLSLLTITCFAQDDLPKDYLTKDFHAGRREALRKMMPDNSVAIVFAFPTRNKSNDVDFFLSPES